MKGVEFIRLVSKLARKRSIAVRFDRNKGKGSQGTLWYGNRRTIVKDRKKEIGPDLFNDMLEQLGIDKDEL